MSLSDENNKGYEVFRDCLASALITKLTAAPAKPRTRRSRKSPTTTAGAAGSTTPATPGPGPGPGPGADPSSDPSDAEDLAEFVDYFATEIFPSLPSDLQTLTHHTWTDASSPVSDRYALPLTGQQVAETMPSLATPEVSDSLSAYGITAAHQTPEEFLAPILTAYVSAASAAPPPPRSTKADAEGCEICGRDWVNLGYHHLIPRFVHDKAVKRGWHKKEDLQNVAWLCGPCHRFVHQFAGHEELARNYFTVERLLAEEEIRAWAGWAGRMRGRKR